MSPKSESSIRGNALVKGGSHQVSTLKLKESVYVVFWNKIPPFWNEHTKSRKEGSNVPYGICQDHTLNQRLKLLEKKEQEEQVRVRVRPNFLEGSLFGQHEAAMNKSIRVSFSSRFLDTVDDNKKMGKSSNMKM